MRAVMRGDIKAKVEPPATIHVYLTPADGLVPLSITEVELPAGASTGDHQHDSDQVVYILDGEARFVSDGEEHHLAKGDLIHIPSGTTHRHECAGSVPLRQLSIFVKRV